MTFSTKICAVLFACFIAVNTQQLDVGTPFFSPENAASEMTTPQLEITSASTATTEASTQASTEASTVASTQASTEASTVASTQASTEASTVASVETHTDSPTEAPTHSTVEGEVDVVAAKEELGELCATLVTPDATVVTAEKIEQSKTVNYKTIYTTARTATAVTKFESKETASLLKGNMDGYMNKISERLYTQTATLTKESTSVIIASCIPSNTMATIRTMKIDRETKSAFKSVKSTVKSNIKFMKKNNLNADGSPRNGRRRRRREIASERGFASADSCSGVGSSAVEDAKISAETIKSEKALIVNTMQFTSVTVTAYTSMSTTTQETFTSLFGGFQDKNVQIAESFASFKETSTVPGASEARMKTALAKAYPPESQLTCKKIMSVLPKSERSVLKAEGKQAKKDKKIMKKILKQDKQNGVSSLLF